MTKLTQDDIVAITSRMDAATVVMIELIAEAHDMDVTAVKFRYTKKYDTIAAKYRAIPLVKDGDKL